MKFTHMASPSATCQRTTLRASQDPSASLRPGSTLAPMPSDSVCTAAPTAQKSVGDEGCVRIHLLVALLTIRTTELAKRDNGMVVLTAPG